MRRLGAAIFLGLPAALVLQATGFGRMLYGADVNGVFHHARIVIADALRSGRLPVWDSGTMAGFPLLAALQSAVFYPPSWLCLLLPAGAFWTLSVPIHMALSGFFARAWLRRGLGASEGAALAGAVIFMASGFFATRVLAGHVNYVWAYPWIAAVLWRLERYLAARTFRRGVLLGAAFAMLFLAGVPQFVLFAAFLALARLSLPGTEGRRGALLWPALGLLFCAPQLFPALELAGQMHRAGTDDAAFLAEYTLPPGGLATLVVPSAGSWETCGYLGAAALVLAGAAFAGRHRQRWLWLGVAVAGLILAMGPGASIAGLGLFRGPGRHLLLFTTAGSALAALGFDALPWRRVAWGLGAVAAIELAAFGARCFIGQEEKGLTWPPEAAAALRERCGPGGRAASTLPAKIDAVGRCRAAGLDHVGGYEPMMLRRYAEFMNVAHGSPADRSLQLVDGVKPGPLMDLLGARLWLSWNEGPPVPGWRFLGRAGSASIYENPGALPRAWLAERAGVLEPRDERLAALAADGFDPRTAILEGGPAASGGGTVRLLSKEPGEIRLEADAGGDAVLVVAEAFYPGWSAEVDGKPAEIVPADHLLQAVRVPAGVHQVRFRYRSRFLVPGFLVTILVTAGVAIAHRFP